MPKFYDPITERWHSMPEAKAVERTKPMTVGEQYIANVDRNQRIAEHAHVWRAIEATATATQTATQCPAGSESDESAS